MFIPGALAQNNAPGALAQRNAPGALAQRNALVLQSDFGLKDGAVAAMKGIAFGVDKTLAIFDLTHDIPPFDIW
ncbi:MAG: SAM-dependent chlorinase/fluorinase, partial [Candidatus Competibacteraceae bacterium]|nr:SAM-dependent chlorinase/fluorinase [Candidatus Competibacteraceae bacterium]